MGYFEIWSEILIAMQQKTSPTVSHKSKSFGNKPCRWVSGLTIDKENQIFRSVFVTYIGDERCQNIFKNRKFLSFNAVLRMY